MALFSGKDIEIVPTLASIPFLEDVPRRALKAAGRDASWYSLPAGWPLFKAGEVSDSIYFVLSGSLGAFRIMPDKRSEFIGHIRAGEPVGEMAMLQGGIDNDGDGLPDDLPHKSSVYALRDSEVLQISRAGFERLTKAEPELLSAMIRVILDRLLEGSNRIRRSAPKVFALVATSPTIDIELRAKSLMASLAKLGVKAQIVGETEGDDKPSTFFDQLEANNDIVILTAAVSDTSWYRLSIRQADRIWVVGRADARPSYPLLPRDRSPARSLKLVDVVLIHHDGERKASRPTDWLDASGGARVFHWNDIDRSDCDRLARTVAGRSVGLVMSGGGARAYAHIGVIKALRELGIPIDFVGGTSMGAVIAACCAMGWSDDEIETHIRKGFVSSNPLGDWNMPVVGMVRGHRVNTRLKEHFADIDISELKLPFFAISTNLTDGSFRVHRRGRLRDVLRASISLPGILPPVVDDGEVLVDGGVLNNFPVDIMREIHRGYVIGSDVTRISKGFNAEDFINPPSFLGWIFKHGFSNAPPIAGLLMRTATLSQNYGTGHETVDHLITPDLKDVELRDWKAYDVAVEAGYAAAMAALKDSDLAATTIAKP